MNFSRVLQLKDDRTTGTKPKEMKEGPILYTTRKKILMGGAVEERRVYI